MQNNAIPATLSGASVMEELEESIGVIVVVGCSESDEKIIADISTMAAMP